MPKQRPANKLQLMMKNRKAKGIQEWKAKEEAKSRQVSRVQAVIRGAIQRSKLKLWNVAAEVLQAHIRGVVARAHDAKLRTSVQRLQRVFRGARWRQRLRVMSSSLILVQRVLRGKLARLRLKNRKLYRKRVVHSERGVQELLAGSTALCEVLQPGAADGSTNAVTWMQYRDNQTGKVGGWCLPTGVVVALKLLLVPCKWGWWWRWWVGDALAFSQFLISDAAFG
jgi:hypothetical protein